MTVNEQQQEAIDQLKVADHKSSEKESTVQSADFTTHSSLFSESTDLATVISTQTSLLRSRQLAEVIASLRRTESVHHVTLSTHSTNMTDDPASLLERGFRAGI